MRRTKIRGKDDPREDLYNKLDNNFLYNFFHDLLK